MSTTERIAEIRKRLEAATPGPWKRLDSFGFTDGVIVTDEENNVPTEHNHGTKSWTPFVCQPAHGRAQDLSQQAAKNMDLIAHAPSDIAFLLDEVSSLRSEVERLKGTINHNLSEARTLEARHMALFEECELTKQRRDNAVSGMLDAREKLSQAEAEAQEQARLNGMGSEREARLMARVKELERERDALKELANERHETGYAIQVRLEEERGRLRAQLQEMEAERKELEQELNAWMERGPISSEEILKLGEERDALKRDNQELPQALAPVGQGEGWSTIDEVRVEFQKLQAERDALQTELSKHYDVPRCERLADKLTLAMEALEKIAGGPELPLRKDCQTPLGQATYVAQWSQNRAREALAAADENPKGGNPKVASYLPPMDAAPEPSLTAPAQEKKK